MKRGYGRASGGIDEAGYRQGYAGIASRSSAAACSGATELISIPVPSSNPARTDRRGAISMCQWNSPLPAGRGPDPEVELRAVAEQRRERGQRPAEHCDTAVVALEARLDAARQRAASQRRSRGPGADQRRLAVDRHEPVAAADLLDEHVLEQVAAHRPLVVGGEALALARHLGRHEREREELRVGVREGRAGKRPLVDAEVDERGRRRRGRRSGSATRPLLRPAPPHRDR